jgi:hypothetical protein
MTIEKAYYISELEEIMDDLSPDIMNNGSPNQGMRIHAALTYLLPLLKGEADDY